MSTPNEGYLSIYRKKQQLTKISNDQPSNNKALNRPQKISLLSHDLRKLPTLNLRPKVSLVNMNNDLLPSVGKLSPKSAKKNCKPPSGKVRSRPSKEEDSYEPFPRSAVDSIFNKKEFSPAPPPHPRPLHPRPRSLEFKQQCNASKAFNVNDKNLEEILEQCIALGIDPSKEPDLVYIAKEALKAPLPNNWKPVTDRNGQIFYYDTNTNESTWEHPCDTYYQNLLQKEREKIGQQKSLMSNNGAGIKKSGSSNGRRLLTLQTSNEKKPIPDLPPPLTFNKPPPLAPIGAPFESLGGQPGPLGALPPLKPVSSVSKQPLSTLPSLAQEPLSLYRAPPLLSKFSNVPMKPTNEDVLKPPTTKTGSENVKGYGSGAARSNIGRREPDLEEDFFVVPECNRPKYSYNNMSADIHLSDVAPLEYQEEYDEETTSEEEEVTEEEEDVEEEVEEQEEEVEEVEEEKKEVEEEKSFDTKHNIMVMDDLPNSTNKTSDATDSTDNTSTNGDDQQHEEKIDHKETVTAFQSSDFLKPLSTENPRLPPISSPMGSPSMRPRAAKGLRTTAAAGGVPSSLASPKGQQQYSNAAAIMANTRELAELDKKHQNNLEKMRQDHANEIEQHRKQFLQQINEEKDNFAKEKSRKLLIIKDKQDVALIQEEKKMESEHRERIESVNKTLKEIEDNLAAIRQGHAREIEQLREKCGQEINEEKESLGKEKSKKLSLIKDKYDADLIEEEKRVESDHHERIESVKKTLKEEEAILNEKKETTLAAISQEHDGKIEQLREKCRQEINEENESLGKEKSKKLSIIKDKHNVDLVEEEKKMESDHRERMESVHKTLKKEGEEAILHEKNKDNLAAIRREHDGVIEQLREKCRQEIEQEKESLGKEKSKKLSLIKDKYDADLIEEEKRMESDHHERMESVKKTLKEEEGKEEAILNEKKEDALRATRRKNDKMISDYNARQSQLQLSEEVSTEELKTIQLAIAKEKKALNELEMSREAIAKAILELKQEKRGLEDGLKMLSIEQKNQSLIFKPAIPSHTLPQSDCHILPSIDNLVFSNPAANSTTVSGDTKNMSSDSSTASNDKETISSVSASEEKTRMGSGGVSSEGRTRRGSGGVSSEGRTRRGSGGVSNEGQSDQRRISRTLHVSELQSISIQPELMKPPTASGPLPFQQTSNGPLPFQQTSSGPLPFQQPPSGPLPFQQPPSGPLPFQQTSSGPMQGSPYLQQGCLHSCNGFQQQYCHHCCGHQQLEAHNNNNWVSNREQMKKDALLKLAQGPVRQLSKIDKLLNQLSDDEISDITDEDSISMRNINRPQKIRTKSEKHARKCSLQYTPDQTSSGVSVTLERISGQLGEVIYRLNKKDEKYNSRSPMRYRHDDEEEERWRYRNLEMDKEMHDKWQAHLDQAARDEELRRQSCYIVHDPPVGKTRTDIAGQLLVQKQRDWLHEFRQSIPPLRAVGNGGSYRTRI